MFSRNSKRKKKYKPELIDLDIWMHWKLLLKKKETKWEVKTLTYLHFAAAELKLKI